MTQAWESFEPSYACLQVALHHAPGHGVLAAEHDGKLAATQDVGDTPGDGAHHGLRLGRAIDGVPRVDALGAGVARAVPALELSRRFENCRRSQRRPAAVGDRLLVGNRDDVKARIRGRELRQFAGEKAAHDNRPLKSS